jgi:hypothetical protein
LLTRKYRELKESYEKLLSSHKSTLISYEELKLAHEVSITKVTYCEPHVKISTTHTQNVVLPCASPSDSSRYNIATSCDELVDLTCCSNNKSSTSSSTCITTNLVEKIKELKAQVSSLEKDLEKCQEGNSTLNDMLSVPRFPKDKSGLGFNSNDKNKSKFNNKMGQDKVKNLAKIICFKCKVKGNHVRDCPLKKKHLSEKQQGKQPHDQIQIQVEVMRLPKKIQNKASQVKKSKMKNKESTCYVCREKGHFGYSCLNGTSSNPIIIDDDYSLRKDTHGNVFAKFFGTHFSIFQKWQKSFNLVYKLYLSNRNLK